MKKEAEMVSTGMNEVATAVADVGAALRKSGLYEQLERFAEALRSSGYFEMQERVAAAVRSSGMNDVAECLREATASVSATMAAVQIQTIKFPDVPTVELPELPTIELPPDLTTTEPPELAQDKLLAAVNVAKTREQNLLGDIGATLQKLFAWLQPKMAPAAEAVSRLVNWLGPKVAPVASAVSSLASWLAPKLKPVLEATRQIGAWVAPRIGPCLKTLRIIAEDFREARKAWEHLSPDHKRCFAAIDAAARDDQTWLRGFVKELGLGIKGVPWRDLVQLATFHILERNWLFSHSPREYIRRKVRDDHYGRRSKIDGLKINYGMTLDARLQWHPKSPLSALLEKERRGIIERSLSSVGTPARRHYFEERLWNGRRPREAAALLGFDHREGENAAEHFRRWVFNEFGWKLSEG